jgi:hypothetical protein
MGRAWVCRTSYFRSFSLTRHTTSESRVSGLFPRFSQILKRGFPKWPEGRELPWRGTELTVARHGEPARRESAVSGRLLMCPGVPLFWDRPFPRTLGLELGGVAAVAQLFESIAGAMRRECGTAIGADQLFWPLQPRHRDRFHVRLLSSHSSRALLLNREPSPRAAPSMPTSARETS